MRKLIYEIKNLRGFVLGVGYIKDKMLKEMDKNDYIEVDLLTNDLRSALKRKDFTKEERKRKGKSVNIRRLKKYFKKKRPDYIVCNVDDVMRYIRFFIKDSVYITNKAIYVYSDSNKINLDDIKSRYKRYIKDIETFNDYIVINTTDYHYNIFKNIWYFIVDIFVSIYDYIGNILAG